MKSGRFFLFCLLVFAASACGGGTTTDNDAVTDATTVLDSASDRSNGSDTLSSADKSPEDQLDSPSPDSAAPDSIPGGDTSTPDTADTAGPQSDLSVFDPTHPLNTNLTQNGLTPAPDPDGGSFRIKCDFSHANYDDPIVFPGQQGKSHLHIYFGNTLARFDSTTHSLLTSGESTCHGGVLNRSGYWIPTLLAPKYDQNGTMLFDQQGHRQAAAVLPISGVEGPDIYYKTAVTDLKTIQPMPAGLRMIVGNAKAKGPQDKSVVRWSCQSQTITSEDDFLSHLPSCKVGDRVLLTVSFPSCWDGKNLDSSDHKSHMAYPGAHDWPNSTALTCPTSHPIPVPIVSYNIAFPVTQTNAGPDGTSKNWFLSSDMYDLDQNSGGYSAHGDWMMAWNPEIMQTFVIHCLQAGRHCSNGELGNGWIMNGHQSTGSGFLPPITNQGMSP